MVLQQRNVWSPSPRAGGPNGSFGASTGGNSILGKRIGYVLSGSYGYSEEVRADEQFAVGNQGANNPVVPLTSVSGSTGRSSAQWGGIANFSTLLGNPIMRHLAVPVVPPPHRVLAAAFLYERLNLRVWRRARSRRGP